MALYVVHLAGGDNGFTSIYDGTLENKQIDMVFFVTTTPWCPMHLFDARVINIGHFGTKPKSKAKVTFTTLGGDRFAEAGIQIC